MFGAANEGGAQTERDWSDAADLHAGLEEPGLEEVSHFNGGGVEPNKGAVAAHAGDHFLPVSLHVAQFNFEEAACVVHQLQQTPVLDLLPSVPEI